MHERTDADKASEQAALHRVPSMLAAGWGSFGVVEHFDIQFDASTPPARPTAMSAVVSLNVLRSFTEPSAPYEPGSASLNATAHAAAPASLDELAEVVARHLQTHGGSEAGVAAAAGGMRLHVSVQQVLDELVALGLDIDLAWWLLARWVFDRSGGLADRAAEAALQAHRSGIDATLLGQADRLLQQHLGHYPNHGWGPSRSQRLGNALQPPLV